MCFLYIKLKIFVLFTKKMLDFISFFFLENVTYNISILVDPKYIFIFHKISKFLVFIKSIIKKVCTCSY